MSELDESQPANVDQSVAAESAITDNQPMGFHDSLSEDLRGDPSLADFKDVNSLAKSYVSAQKMIGSSIRIPGENAGEEQIEAFYKELEKVPGVARQPDWNNKEQVDQFYNQLGRPETPDGYNFSEYSNSIEQYEAGNDVEAFKDFAHSLGLTAKQASAIVGWQMGNFDSINTQLSGRAAEATNMLKSEWGQDFDTRAHAAGLVLDSYAEKYPDAVNEIRKGGLRSNPVIMLAMGELARSYQEKGDPIMTKSSRFGESPAEAKMKIDEINMNKNHPYWSGDPTAVAEMNRLWGVVSSGQ